VHPHYHLAAATLGLMAVATNITAVWRARFVLDGLGRKTAASAPHDEREPHRAPSAVEAHRSDEDKARRAEHIDELRVAQ
jgi:hypothetical protein